MLIFLLKGTFREDKGLFIHFQRPVQLSSDFHVTHEKHMLQKMHTYETKTNSYINKCSCRGKIFGLIVGQSGKNLSTQAIE